MAQPAGVRRVQRLRAEEAEDEADVESPKELFRQL